MELIKSYKAEKLTDYDDICLDILAGRKYKHFLLTGELGAGKTSLVKSFCKQMSCTDPVSSPTFSIVNEYHSGEGIIYHFDLYRLQNIEELIGIGIEEYLAQDAFCFIEWPELFLKIRDYDYHKIEIKNLDNSTRWINFS